MTQALLQITILHALVAATSTTLTLCYYLITQTTPTRFFQPLNQQGTPQC